MDSYVCLEKVMRSAIYEELNTLLFKKERITIVIELFERMLFALVFS